jgi:hypothetical protein
VTDKGHMAGSCLTRPALFYLRRPR